MKRQAILIGAPGQEDAKKYLHGVEYDIKNYIKFLKSPTGGAWDKSEIISIKNPDKNTLLNTINKVDTDYLLIVFSGHGAYSLQGQTILAINRTEYLTLNNLIAKKVPKQMLIVDACRSFVDSGISGFLGEKLRSFPSRLLKTTARQLFDGYINRCENGIVVCYSCSVGQTSFDSNDGGYFTTSLLDTTKEWLEKPSTFNILPIHHAFTKTKNYIVNYLTDEQTPQLKVNKQRKFWFPFAVRQKNQILCD